MKRAVEETIRTASPPDPRGTRTCTITLDCFVAHFYGGPEAFSLAERRAFSRRGGCSRRVLL